MSFVVACVASDILETPTGRHRKRREYPPIVRLVGSLWKILCTVHDGNLLHDQNAIINQYYKQVETPCTQCGSQKNERVQDEQSSACCICPACGIENPGLCIKDSIGEWIGIGSIIKIGPQEYPGIIISIDRRNKCIDCLSVTKFGRIVLKRQTFHEKEIQNTKVIDKNIIVYKKHTKLNGLSDEDALTLRRLTMSLSEHCICGRCDDVYYIGDLLSRKVRDLQIAADTVVSLKYEITSLKAQKEMSLNSLKVNSIGANVEEKKRIWEEGEEEKGEGKSGEISEDIASAEEKKQEFKEINKDDKDEDITETTFFEEDDREQNKMTIDEKKSMKKKIITLASLIRDKNNRLLRLMKLQRGIVFSCPNCGWLPWQGSNLKR
jgi:predicted RNA-binding Zn-ribbon protein involved in translation (DUF1610 family)